MTVEPKTEARKQLRELLDVINKESELWEFKQAGVTANNLMSMRIELGMMYAELQKDTSIDLFCRMFMHYDISVTRIRKCFLGTPNYTKKRNKALRHYATMCRHLSGIVAALVQQRAGTSEP